MDYSNLTAEILNKISSDKQLKIAIASLNSKIKSGNVNYSDAVKMSRVLGKTTSKYLNEYNSDISENELYEFAEKIVAPVYRSIQRTSLSACRKIQKNFNKKIGLDVNPAEVPNDENRIVHIVSRFREAKNFENVKFLLGEGVSENIARGAITDSLKKNAQMLDKIGFETYVIREGAGCCEWCEQMTGVYAINEAPEDFWKVHKGCTCQIEYKVKNKHTRVTFSTDANNNLRKNTEDN